MKKHINDRLRTWCESGKALFFALIAEMDLVIKNLINIFFVTHFVGAEGAAAYEIIMPCVMVASALVALGYNGVQAVCAKDYGAGDHELPLPRFGFALQIFGTPFSLVCQTSWNTASWAFCT